jgi:hypothetical protein
VSRAEIKARRRRMMIALDTIARRQPHSTPEEGAGLLLMVLAAWGDAPSDDADGTPVGSSGAAWLGAMDYPDDDTLVGWTD